MRLVYVCAVAAVFFAPSTPAAQSLRGRVIDAATRQPVNGVSIRLLRDDKTITTTTSDSAGRFIVHAAEEGKYKLAASRIGYADATTGSVDLVREEIVNALLELTTQAVSIATLTVEATRNAYLESAGFYERKQAGTGDFMTSDQVRKRNAPTLSDLLRGLRGIRVQRVNYTTEVYFAGANCHPMIIVDGVTMRRGGKTLGVTQPLDDLLSVAHIDAIEAYRGGSGVPTQFVGPNAGCGVILIWTRHK